MKIFSGKFEDLHQNDEIVIALGMFDGVHRGHQTIIKEAVEIAKKRNMKSAVFTFDIHPRFLIEGVEPPKIVTDNLSKSKILETLGIDYLYFVRFDEELRDLENYKFIEGLVKKLNCKVIVCGYNYTFGKDGIGNIQLLNKYKENLSYDLNIVDRVSFNGSKISTTSIRKKILSGNISEANRLLGYSLFFTGKVVKGKGLANTIGFPTANIIIDDNLCFRNGVYITLTKVKNNIYPSITNVGYAPTVESQHRVMETNIFDFHEDIYGETITVEFLDFLRGEVKFSSVEELKERVDKDIKYSKEYFKNNVYNI